MTVRLAPMFNDAQLDASGNPASGWKVFTYVGGSSTKTATYQDSGGVTPHSNPIVLNSRGEPPAPIWLTSGATYKFVLTSPTDSDPPVSATRTVDLLSGVNDTTVSIDQWVSGPAPTFVGTTSFTLVGDQTSTFHVGRRVKTTNSGGTIYSVISVSAYTSLTTITVVNDSGVLDSGLSAVSYGLVSSVNGAAPVIRDDRSLVAGSVDPSKQVRFEVDGLTTATTRVITVPDANLTLPIFTTGIGAARTVPTVNAGATALAYQAPITIATEQASTSGTAIDFTGIPAGVRRITIHFTGVSLSGTDHLAVQIGDAGGIETSAYISTSLRIANAAASAANSSTAAFCIYCGTAAYIMSGHMTLTLTNAATFAWVSSHCLKSDTLDVMVGGGNKSLSAELTQVRVTSAVGSDTFDAGAITISYE